MSLACLVSKLGLLRLSQATRHVQRVDRGGFRAWGTVRFAPLRSDLRPRDGRASVACEAININCQHAEINSMAV